MELEKNEDATSEGEKRLASSSGGEVTMEAASLAVVDAEQTIEDTRADAPAQGLSAGTATDAEAASLLCRRR